MSESAGPRNWRPPPLREAPPPAAVAEDPAHIAAAARREGYAAGHAEGLAAGRARSEALAREMTALWHGMSTPYRDQEAVLIGELASLVARVARAVVMRELTTDAGLIEQTLSEALDVLGSAEGTVDVYLNPADLAAVRDLSADMLLRASVRLHEDNALIRGGCRIVTPVSYVDASIERRLEDVLQLLQERALAGSDGEAEP